MHPEALFIQCMQVWSTKMWLDDVVPQRLWQACSCSCTVRTRRAQLMSHFCSLRQVCESAALCAWTLTLCICFNVPHMCQLACASVADAAANVHSPILRQRLHALQKYAFALTCESTTLRSCTLRATSPCPCTPSLLLLLPSALTATSTAGSHDGGSHHHHHPPAVRPGLRHASGGPRCHQMDM